MPKRYHEFASLRSDSPEVMKVLEKYVTPGKMVVTGISTRPHEGTWVVRFQVKCTKEEYEALCKDLNDRWLLIEEL
jgi:hypothetical protein